jgi:sec-independent protein translocase protein TatA
LSRIATGAASSATSFPRILWQAEVVNWLMGGHVPFGEMIMGGMSWIHWSIVLVVVILVFGTKKLGNIGGDLGKAVKGFKDGVKGEEDKDAAPSQVADMTTIDVGAREKMKS